MVPGLSCWHLGSRRSKMTFRTADSRAATKEILSMAAGTLIDVLSGAKSVETGTIFIDPGLSQGMGSTCMTIVAGSRAIVIQAIALMTGIAGSNIGG